MIRLLLSVVTFFTILVASNSCLGGRLTTTGETPPLISNGSISGYVYESDGKTPVAGVNVQVLVAEPDFIWRPVGTIVTDANGKYMVGGLRNGGYRLMASATGYRLEEATDGTPCSVVSGETTCVNFKMQALCSISGRVFDESDGKAVANAAVYVGGWHWIVDGCPMAGTAADGSYKVTDLNAGESTLKVVADGYVPRYYDGVYDEKKATMVITRFGENTPDINIGLEKGGSISGRVFQADGTTPATKVYVTWRQILAKDTTDVKTPDPRVGGPLPPDPSVLTNEEGSYIIEGLLTGEYLLIATADGRSLFSSKVVNVTRGGLTQGADLKLTLCGSLSGHVYRSDAKIPVGQGDVYVRAYLGTSTKDESFYERQGMTDQDGSYIIEELPAGKYTVRVDVFTGPGTSGKTYTVNIISGKNTILNFVLQ